MISATTPAFLDTAYLAALVNTRDQWHAAAVQWQQRLAETKRSLVTSEFVLIEIADCLAAVKYRGHATRIIDALRGSELVTVAPASADLFQSALEIYARRADKDWGMTDCSSFAIMSGAGLREALTADDHFRQAGFRALLLEAPLA